MSDARSATELVASNSNTADGNDPSPSLAVGHIQPRGKSKRRWTRTTTNFFLDVLLLVTFLVLVWITFALRLVFPAATTAASWSLWGYGFDDWANLQFIVLLVLMIEILIHVMLHWTWVCGVITNHLEFRAGTPVRWDDGTRTLVGVGILIFIINLMGVLMAIASLTLVPITGSA